MARPPQRIRLGDLLIQQGLLTDEQLKLALDEQKRSGRKLGRIFVDSGYVTEEGIAKALARQLQRRFVDLRNFQPKPELIKLLPEAQARRFRALVLDEQAGLLRVGFADPDRPCGLRRSRAPASGATSNWRWSPKASCCRCSTASIGAPRKSPAWPRN